MCNTVNLGVRSDTFVRFVHCYTATSMPTRKIKVQKLPPPPLPSTL